MPIIYDTKHPSGVAEILLDELSAQEMIGRGNSAEPGRYVRVLPPNTKRGPRSGLDRIVLGAGGV
jgi:hypothetical protein